MRHKDKIENVLIRESKPNILGFTETHVTQLVEDHELQINDYVCMRGDSESSRTGGVLLYIDKSIKFEIMAIETCERNWWTIMVKISNRDFKGILFITRPVIAILVL